MNTNLEAVEQRGYDHGRSGGAFMHRWPDESIEERRNWGIGWRHGRDDYVTALKLENEALRAENVMLREAGELLCDAVEAELGHEPFIGIPGRIHEAARTLRAAL